MDPDRRIDVHEPVRGVNWTMIALGGALLLLVLVVAYFATRGNSDQDKLTNPQVASGEAPGREKLCASKSTCSVGRRRSAAATSPLMISLPATPCFGWKIR